MPINFDLSQYVNPARTPGLVDVTAGYRQWAEQHLREKEQAAQEAQFAQNQARQTSEFNQNLAHQKDVSSDINSRFALEQQQALNEKKFQQLSGQHKQQELILTKARTAAAEGRWNEVESYMGTLKELGANVSRSMDPEGKPIYHLQGGPDVTPTGESFESSMDKINRSRLNPFETHLGTAAQSAQTLRPETVPNPQIDTQQKPPETAPEATAQPATPAEPTINNIGYTDDNQQPQASAQPQQSQSYDPYAINSGELNHMNEMRMQPLMEGIQGAFPNRFQGQIGSLLQGVRSMGASPEGFLTNLQKPMDTAARLMGAELNAEGNMARAGIQAGGQANTEARMRENEAYRRAEQAAKDYGVRAAIDNSVEMKQIHEQLMSDNPNANADGVKALLSMREGNRLTDKDFDIGVSGYASNWDMARQQLARVYHTGLTADQKSHFNQLIRMFLEGNQRRIAAGSKKLAGYINTFRNEPERYGVYNYIRGRIPDEYVTPELMQADPSQNFGGRTPGSQSNSKSIHATGRTTQEAVQGVQDLDSDVEDILK